VRHLLRRPLLESNLEALRYDTRCKGSHSVICHPRVYPEPINHAFAFPAKAGPYLTDPGGMEGWVDLVGWLHTNDGLRVRRRLPIQVQTGSYVDYLRWSDQRR